MDTGLIDLMHQLFSLYIIAKMLCLWQCMPPKIPTDTTINILPYRYNKLYKHSQYPLVEEQHAHFPGWIWLIYFALALDPLWAPAFSSWPGKCYPLQAAEWWLPGCDRTSAQIISNLSCLVDWCCLHVVWDQGVVQGDFTADASHFAHWEHWNYYAPCFGSLIDASTERSHNHVSTCIYTICCHQIWTLCYCRWCVRLCPETRAHVL